jgi:hypothetical protein
MKKKVVMAGGAAAGVVGVRAIVRASRRERAEHAAEGIAETILPTVAERAHGPDVVPVGDEAHAPGHGHLDRSSIREEQAPPAAPPPTVTEHRRG